VGGAHRETRAAGLTLSVSISDAARGLRAGVQAAFPDIDLRGDVLHAQMEMSELLSYLENRAYGRMSRQEQEEHKMVRAKRHQTGQARSKRLAVARTRAREAIRLHDGSLSPARLSRTAFLLS